MVLISQRIALPVSPSWMEGVLIVYCMYLVFGIFTYPSPFEEFILGQYICLESIISHVNFSEGKYMNIV